MEWNKWRFAETKPRFASAVITGHHVSNGSIGVSFGSSVAKAVLMSINCYKRISHPIICIKVDK